MTILIADDEAPSRQKLKRMLGQLVTSQDIIEARDGLEAMELIEQQKPDILVLDIHMPEMTGLEVALEIGDRFPVIFVTAYDEYAIRAFELFAVDYLLKPYSLQRLDVAIQRAYSRIDKPATIPSNELLALAKNLSSQHAPRILVRTGERMLPLSISSINWIASKGNYLELHTEDGKFIERDTMNNFLSRLDSRFIRVHRSFSVKLDQIRKVEAVFKGDYQLTMSDGNTIKLSRHYRDAFFSRFA
ncbi:LytR/AlgR family response regulator transcription factor [Idiomarina xiamenensis]|uniref:LytTR family two component transcriptional regulator n=1 Tax=Idiomarina xiamenensis 10-D-4 TaxID=740709 RepID=K2J7Z7_9GAMM|nr:LytTR family DNA-binding domain-containing protein [Idiomarina xiamenensis]EKE79186.1 LytTR family two component transcriptional regulator [Idiomarina xiamenensis 10-D-4]